MLGLLAHGLHLLLVTLGLAGVAALLLPQLRQTHGGGVPPYRPPATPAEHDERVAALRAAVLSGQLTTSRMTAGASSTPGDSRTVTERDGSLWRSVAVSSSAAAAVVHAAVLPHHLQEGLLLGSFFLFSALAQVGWAFLVMRRASRELLLIGILGNLSFIALWAATRTLGLPFGLVPGPESVGGWDLACVVWEGAVVLSCAAGLHRDQRLRRLALGRLGPYACLWVSLSALALVVLSLAVAHE